MELGYLVLAGAFASAIASCVGFLTAARRGDERGLRVGVGSAVGQALFLTLSSAILLYHLFAKDFNFQYVASHTDRSLSPFYTISAFWAGAEGSLLLWAWVLSLFLLGVMRKERRDALTFYALSIMSSVNIFFSGLLLTVSNPFTRLGFTPEDGMGLNPLLLNPGMWIHPPTLFIGYAGFTIPFAFALSGLLTENELWIFRTRKWSLSAWLFLSIGIFLGGWWSYTVLGWGGYWAWDPVENSSLVPWLVATAFLHSVMIQESKRGMKLWNVLLSIFAFEAVVFATFLTRSGVISSIHAFGESHVGHIFAVYMGVMLLFSLGVLLHKYEQVRSRNIFESILGRESSFLMNNLFFVVMAATVFWGTIFPLVNEAVVGAKMTVGPEFYNDVAGPVMFSLVVLMGVCVALRWRHTDIRTLVNRLRYPFAAGLLLSAAFYFAGYADPVSIMGFSATGFAVVFHAQEYVLDCRQHSRSTGVSFAKSLYRVVLRMRRRYGGYIVHLSMLLMFLGLVGSQFYDETSYVVAERNEPHRVGGYWFNFKGSYVESSSDKSTLTMVVDVWDGVGSAKTLKPSLVYSSKFQSTVANVDILSLPFEDVYVIPEGVEGDSAAIRIRFVPFVSFIWWGGIVMALGVVIGLLSGRKGKEGARG